MDKCSDKYLVGASCTGDRNAYAALVRKHYKNVFLVCVGILGNIHDAEDIAQDAMLKAFVDITKLRDGSQFGPWVKRIAKNRCINFFRREQHSRKVIEEKAKQQSKAITQNDKLHRAIEKLSQEFRLPLVMYYLDGRSARNVAEKLNISIAGVYVKLRTATLRLHEILAEGDSE